MGEQKIPEKEEKETMAEYAKKLMKLGSDNWMSGNLTFAMEIMNKLQGIANEAIKNDITGVAFKDGSELEPIDILDMWMAF